MRMPGFGAEASVYPRTPRYSGISQATPTDGVTPAGTTVYNRQVGGDGSTMCGACFMQGCDCEVTSRDCGPFGWATCYDRKCVSCNPSGHVWYQFGAGGPD